MGTLGLAIAPSLAWWIAVELIGLASLPLALRWLRWLPDRGYSFGKPLGILLVSYLLWLGASFGIVENTAPTIALILIGLGAVCWLRYWPLVAAYWQTHRALLLASEALFAVAFLVWTVVRAYDPAISGTEKPMEIAFLSATMRSAQFPPVDPWLSGHGISYYYFGYVAMGVLAKLAGIAAPVAFNLALALLFGLTVTGAFTLGYNLAALRSEIGRRVIDRSAAACGLLAALLVAISANLEVIVEMLDARGWVSTQMWRWLQIRDLPAPYLSPTGMPADYWWWFRATRVIGDFDLATKAARDYTINEFPFFSFMLGDLHPHVLALPFALLALAVALNLFLCPDETSAATLWQGRGELLLIGLVFGGLSFLNSWDMPAYLLVLTVAFAAVRYRRHRRLDGRLLREAMAFGALAFVASIVLYLPFYVGFRSQAMGLGLVGVRTQLHHFAIFWAPLFFLAISWLVVQLWTRNVTRGARDHGHKVRTTNAARIERTLDNGLIDGAAAGGPRVSLAMWSFAANTRALQATLLLGVALSSLVLLRATVAAMLIALLACGGAVIWHRLQRDDGQGAGIFVTVLLLTSMFLLLICEGVFIRDYFNNRMNTVFKLYYQAWLMLAVAGGYVLYSFAVWLRRTWRGRKARVLALLWSGVACLMLAASLVYPVAAIQAKTDGFAGRPTLDGQAFLAQSQPDDDKAIRWLNANVQGTPTILESTGGSYSAAARVSAFTGLPTLLGWDFHEQQWRGSFDEQGRRKTDIDAIYSSVDRTAAETLLRKYRVTFVYVGGLERDSYGKFGPLALEKFATFMEVAYRGPGTIIYRMRE